MITLRVCHCYFLTVLLFLIFIFISSLTGPCARLLPTQALRRDQVQSVSHPHGDPPAVQVEELLRAAREDQDREGQEIGQAQIQVCGVVFVVDVILSVFQASC